MVISYLITVHFLGNLVIVFLWYGISHRVPIKILCIGFNGLTLSGIYPNRFLSSIGLKLWL